MLRMMIFYFYVTFVAGVSPVFSLSLKEKFQNFSPAYKGSFVVTEHQKTISFLRLHSLDGPFLFLEEINLPSHFLMQHPRNWDEWLKEKAPHHTSWLLYQVDLNQCKIVDCYSFSKESYISLHEQQSFLTTLMTLPLEPVPPAERKRIGSKSQEDLDTRKIWNPPKIINGQHYSKPRFEMMHARWPKDDSELSGKLIDLYFDQDQPQFPFPYWIEIGDGYNVFKIRVIDSGISVQFPFKKPPNRPPAIDTVTVSASGLEIVLKDALSLQHVQVILSTLHHELHHTVVLPCQSSVQGHLLHLFIPNNTLTQHLHAFETADAAALYSLTVAAADPPTILIEYSHPLRLHKMTK